MTPAELLVMALVLAQSDEAPTPLATIHLSDGDRELVLDRVRGLRADEEAGWHELSLASGALDVPRREGLLRLAIHTIMADADLADAEIQLLQRLAQELAIPTPRVRELMREAFRASRDTPPPVG